MTRLLLGELPYPWAWQAWLKTYMKLSYLLSCSLCWSEGGATQQGEAISLLLGVPYRVTECSAIRSCIVMCNDANTLCVTPSLLAELLIFCCANLAQPNRVRALLLC